MEPIADIELSSQLSNKNTVYYTGEITFFEDGKCDFTVNLVLFETKRTKKTSPDYNGIITGNLGDEVGKIFLWRNNDLKKPYDLSGICTVYEDSCRAELIDHELDGLDPALFEMTGKLLDK